MVLVCVVKAVVEAEELGTCRVEGHERLCDPLRYTDGKTHENGGDGTSGGDSGPCYRLR